LILKSRVLEAVRTFDDEIEIDELLERLVILNKISEAERQIENGAVLKEEEADKKIDAWFK
jgi:predicted transcriptional regulator